MRKALLLLAFPLGLALLLASQRRDIARYVQLKRMSIGRGQPQVVPAGGARAYPSPGHGAADGTGEFDSARRGGPSGGR